jgi:hypothetical protein
MTKENDIVLIYFENQPMVFARIESIAADHKRDWYHVKMLFLNLPLKVFTWILKTAYINGEEFTMNGRKIRIEKVECPVEPELSNDAEKEELQDKQAGKSKIISISDIKKK